MSTLALNLADSIREARRNRPRASRSKMPCLVCGNPISAENCKPIMQPDGEWNRLRFATDLARVFGTSADFWLNLDVAWQQQQAAKVNEPDEPAAVP